MKPVLHVIFACACLVLALSVEAVDATYVAKVNGNVIPVSALDQALAEARAAGGPETPELRTLLIERLIADELFWQKAAKLKLQNTAAASAAAERARRQSAIAQYLLREAKPAVPQEAELRATYERTVARLGPREYRISLIQTTSEASLREVAARLAKGADFATEAHRVSEVASAEKGGTIGWVSFPVPPVPGRTNGLPLVVAQAIVGLKPGAISTPLAFGDSFALVRLDDERATQTPSFEASKASLVHAAQLQAIAAAGRDLALRLTRDARIKLNPALASGVSVQP